MSAAVAAPAPRPIRVALVGAPNTGKTTLFNALTGSTARVGNYPGVTVERREGRLRDSEAEVDILDLPGTYALHGETPDEQVVTRVLAGEQAGEQLPDALVVVADATTLRRGLGLVHEAIGRGLPTLIVLTMIDEVKARGGSLDPMHVSRLLGAHVVGVVGHRGVGLEPLRRLLEDPSSWPRPELPTAKDRASRFAWVDQVCDDLAADELRVDQNTQRLDRVLLHPIAGPLIFLGVMVFLFQSIFAWAVPVMDWLDESFGALVAWSHEALPAGLLTDLWADGIVAGVGSVVIFLPQILILFAFLHFLQDVGYMARAAFVVDRVMGWVGLQGRSFVPLLSCYACAIPGMMAARTIGSPRERIATILVAPFMTCSARLPVYTLLIAAFVPAETVLGPIGLQGLVMFGLYLLGALAAFGSAALLNRTLLKGSISVFYMELPPYRFPTPRLLLSQIWESGSAFLKRAGTIILVASMVLWALLTFPQVPSDPALTPEQQASAGLEASYGGQLGQAIEPVIEPLGFDWKIGVGLVASLAAREVIISTLAQIYAVGDEDYGGLREALQSDINPRTGKRAFTLATALSLMVFFVFALQCTSTVAVMARETGSWGWPTLAFSYMLALAWVGSFITYNLALVLL